MYLTEEPGIFPVGKVFNGYTIVGAVIAVNQGNVNGFPVYCVIGDDGNGNAVTWFCNYGPNEEKTRWEISFYWGHYFHGEITVEYETPNTSGSYEKVDMSALRRATYDMAKRIGISADLLAVTKREV